MPSIRPIRKTGDAVKLESQLPIDVVRVIPIIRVSGVNR
jgi:hypothetical protein